jgi:hypothetical protein
MTLTRAEEHISDLLLGALWRLVSEYDFAIRSEIDFAGFAVVRSQHIGEIA